MKLNSAAEIEPISYPGFAGLHPFVPDSDAQGMHELIDELERLAGRDQRLRQGLTATQLGAQGEFAGLMAIRRYYRARGEDGRTVCLIPSSAHGTIAASATMAGLKVVVVKATEDGSIDLDDLRAKVAAHAGRLAAIMITYPSTHGVFEDTISTACELVHSAGGQVYVDGAYMNALVGLAGRASSGPMSAT
jgi:glycine dehydrogenase